MATAGPKFPSAASSLSNAGTSENAEAWVNPTNIFSDNGSEATITAATYDSPDISQLLVASNFGFQIPASATINGITVEIERRDQAIGAASDNRVQLAKGTTFADLVGNNKADTALDWPTAVAIKTYGANNDLWGASWSAADINSTTFAVMLSVQADAANTDIFVDYIRVTVDYTYTASAYESAVLALSPSAYWRLGDTAGTVAVAAVGPNGTYRDVGGGAGPTVNQTGLLTGDTDKAAVWADAGDEVQLANHASLNFTAACTLIAWIKPSSWTGDNRVFQKGLTDNQYDLTRQGGTTLRFFLRGTANEFAESSVPSTGVVTMVACTWDAAGDGFVRLYYNGSLVNTSGAAFTGTMDTTTDAAAIGNKPADNTEGDEFIGTIDEVAIWNNLALSAAQILTLYNTGINNLGKGILFRKNRGRIIR